jgi:hypothetical protein
LGRGGGKVAAIKSNMLEGCLNPKSAVAKVKTGCYFDIEIPGGGLVVRQRTKKVLSKVKNSKRC